MLGAPLCAPIVSCAFLYCDEAELQGITGSVGPGVEPSGYVTYPLAKSLNLFVPPFPHL